MRRIFKYIVIIAMMLAMVGMSVSAGSDWPVARQNLFRTGFVTGSLDSTDVTTLNFTCGTGTTQAHSVQPAIGDYDGNASNGNEMIVSCSGDSLISTSHLYILSSNLDLIDSITLTTTFTADNNRYRQFDTVDYDNDGMEEVVVYYPRDIAGTDKKIELIMYKFNTTSRQFQYEGNFPYVNNSANYTESGWENVPVPEVGASDLEINSFIQCMEYDDSCTVFHQQRVEKINLSGGTFSIDWVNDTRTLTDDEFWGDLWMTPGTGSSDQEMYPIIIDNDNDLSLKINLLDGRNDTYLKINYTSGEMLNYTILNPGVFDSTLQSSWSAVTCDSSQCVNPNIYFVVAESITEQCYLVDSTDMQVIKKLDIDTDGDITANGGTCWVEDRDNDGTDELCGTMFDFGANSKVRCEEISFFGQDTLDETVLEYTSLTEPSDNIVSNSVAIGDVDGDGLYDLVVPGTVWLLEETFLNTIENSGFFLNGSYTGAGGDGFSMAVAEFSSTSSLDVMLIPVSEELDIWFLLTTSAVSQLNITSNDVPEFDNNPYPQIESPICNTTRLKFNCSYADGCISDTETDKIKMSVDCFSDGSQVYTDTRFTLFGLKDISGCDLRGIEANTTQYYNATFTVWDNQHDPSENTTTKVAYSVASTNCNDQDSPGQVDPGVETNVAPKFNFLPQAIAPQPFCLNSSIIYTCSNGDCYNDTEDDPVYFKIDCNNDGTYELTTTFNTTQWSCRFNSTNITQMNVQVWDGYHTVKGDEIAVSVDISSTILADLENVSTEEEVVCYDSSLIGGSGQIVLPDGSKPSTESSKNFLYRFYLDLSNALYTPMSIIAIFLSAILSVILYWKGATSKKVSHPGIMSIGTFVILVLIHTLAGIISIVPLVLLILIGAAVIAFGIKGGS